MFTSAIGHAVSIELLDEREALKSENCVTSVNALNHTVPQNSEELREVFLLKKKIVDTLVEKVTIDKDRTLHVHIRLNLLGILEDDANSGGPIESAVATEKVGIYSRISDLYRAELVTVMT